MTDGYDDRPLQAGSASDAVDPELVGEVEDALSGTVTPTPDPNRVLGADPHDFASLYIRHRSSFGNQARRFLRDQRDVDEVVQEAFLRLFLALPELETELQALAYCRRTVTNLCIDRYRADMRRPKLVNIEALPASEFPDDEIDDPVVQAEDAAFVREALSLLTPLHRQALIKREIEEKSIPVIAAELDVPEESVKHLLHRARRALRRHLAKTHLAPGADLEATSTLALLGRSAAASGGKLGVVIVFLGLVLLGAKPEVGKTVLTSWPLGDIIPAVGHVLAPATVPDTPQPTPEAAPSRERDRVPVAAPAQRPEPQTTPLLDTFVGLTVPTTAPSPTASQKPVPATPSPSASPVTDASPSASPSGSPSPSPSTSPSGAGSPSPSTSASPSPSASDPSTASGSPRPRPTSDGVKPDGGKAQARSESAQPSPSDEPAF